MDPIIIGAGIGAAANIFSASQAQHASGSAYREDWSNRLSAAQNAHAYEVADLRRAGLNPILSATGGRGATVGGGGMAQGFDARAGDAISSAMHANVSRKLSDSQVDLNESTATNQKQDAALKSYDMNVRKSTEHLQQQQLATERHRTDEQKWNASTARWLYESAKAQGKFDEKVEEYGPGTRFLLEILRGVRPAPGRR